MRSKNLDFLVEYVVNLVQSEFHRAKNLVNLVQVWVILLPAQKNVVLHARIMVHLARDIVHLINFDFFSSFKGMSYT